MCKDDDHKFGPVEEARFTGNPHRKCKNCKCVSLDIEEEEDFDDDIFLGYD